ncbi:MAG: hypothetical protein SFU91_09380 [Chloroherpetonaceae bacterium]|nr:hypothetical protein [Chloroherpetonaceae bacterium]
MFQFSRRTASSIFDSPSTHKEAPTESTGVAPRWAELAAADKTNPVITQTNIAAACPFCVNYDLTTHMCTLYGEPIPQVETNANPCKGNTFSRKFFSGNRLAQLRSLRG